MVAPKLMPSFLPERATLGKKSAPERSQRDCWLLGTSVASRWRSSLSHSGFQKSFFHDQIVKHAANALRTGRIAI